VMRQVLTDGLGAPLSVLTTGANVHDQELVGGVLDAVAFRDPRGIRRPKQQCLDEGHGDSDAEATVRSRGILPHSRRRGEPPTTGCVVGKSRRRAVERTTP
jgi:putative transposase